MEMIDSINIEKFNDAMVVIGKGPCVKFDCDRQSVCAVEKVELLKECGVTISKNPSVMGETVKSVLSKK